MGEFIEKNMFQVISLIVSIIGVVIWLVRIEAKVNQLSEENEAMQVKTGETEKSLLAHTADQEKHVNILYMSTLKDRLTKLEVEVKEGNKRVEDKIDKLTEQVFKLK